MIYTELLDCSSIFYHCKYVLLKYTLITWFLFFYICKKYPKNRQKKYERIRWFMIVRSFFSASFGSLNLLTSIFLPFKKRNSTKKLDMCMCNWMVNHFKKLLQAKNVSLRLKVSLLSYILFKCYETFITFNFSSI